MTSTTEVMIEKKPSMNPLFAVRFKFERTEIMTDMVGVYCANPFCPCRTVTLDFFEANDKFDNMLLRLVVNYDTWQAEGSEFFSQDLDCAEIADEFMSGLDDQFKDEILSHIEPKAKSEHALRERIDLPEFDAEGNSLVVYSEIYRIEPYENLVFEFDGKEYLVFDQYCPRPTCDCKEVVLVFYLVEEDSLKSEHVLAYRVEFETGKKTVLGKEAGVSNRLARDLYRGLTREFATERNAISFFENRYWQIKKWGATYFGAAGDEINETPETPGAPVKAAARKIGRNDPCPCGSGKKYKKCCGA